MKVTLLAIGSLLQTSPIRPAHMAPARATACYLLDWPWGALPQDASEATGKFIRHSELSPGGAPRGVVVAGLSVEELEVLAEAIESVWSDPEGQITHVPIVVLAHSDLRLPLRQLLAMLDERDSQLPESPAQPRVPLVLLSGFSTVQTSSTVRAIRALDLRGGDESQKLPMLSVVVPNALGKTLRVLIDELEGDHFENGHSQKLTS